MKYYDVLGLLKSAINSTPGIEIKSVMELECDRAPERRSGCYIFLAGTSSLVTRWKPGGASVNMLYNSYLWRKNKLHQAIRYLTACTNSLNKLIDNL